MMLITKAGFKLWGSGMLVLVCDLAYVLMMENLNTESLTLGGVAFMTLVVMPLAVGWVQRWYWTPKAESDDAGIQL